MLYFVTLLFISLLKFLLLWGEPIWYHHCNPYFISRWSYLLFFFFIYACEKPWSFLTHVNIRLKIWFILLSTIIVYHSFYFWAVVRGLGAIGWCLCFLCARMRILPCGFKGLALEQCLQFLPAHTTTSRGRITNKADSGKASNHHSILDLLGTLISTILRVAFPWNISSRILGKHPWLVLKPSHPSSPNNYGRTATNLNHLPVFKGLDVSLKVMTD